MTMKKTNLILLSLAVLAACTPKKKEIQEPKELFAQTCGSCHKAPDIQELPKTIWNKNILPEMGARLGIRENGFDPYKGINFNEQNAVIHSGIYPDKPIIPQENWERIKDYILSLAPDSLNNTEPEEATELTLFKPQPFTVDPVEGSPYTYMQFDTLTHNLILGDLNGLMNRFDFATGRARPMGELVSAVSSFTQKNGLRYITAMGSLNPSDLVDGQLFVVINGQLNTLGQPLHRPVHTLVEDLNGDGVDEIVVCEYGNLTGALSLFKNTGDKGYQKTVLLNQPGSIRSIAKDMDNDGKLDLVVLHAQGDEGVSIFYQQDNLNFKRDEVIKTSPVFGSSWFELVDYDGDGDQDIIVANGDNADDSFVLKPYHGVRIYLNDGKNAFKEAYFYPLHGATRLLARDFDQDGDIDLAVVAAFPDYNKHPERSFVYLENTDAKNFSFTTHTFAQAKVGKWFLMDAADVDGDGDEDLILSSFTFPFSPAPEAMTKYWIAQKADLMLLENQLKAN